MLNTSPAGDQVMFRVWVKNEVDVPCFHWFFYLALFYLALKRDLDSFLESKFINDTWWVVPYKPAKCSLHVKLLQLRLCPRKAECTKCVYVSSKCYSVSSHGWKSLVVSAVVVLMFLTLAVSASLASLSDSPLVSAWTIPTQRSNLCTQTQQSV